MMPLLARIHISGAGVVASRPVLKGSNLTAIVVWEGPDVMQTTDRCQFYMFFERHPVQSLMQAYMEECIRRQKLHIIIWLDAWGKRTGEDEFCTITISWDHYTGWRKYAGERKNFRLDLRRFVRFRLSEMEYPRPMRKPKMQQENANCEISLLNIPVIKAVKLALQTQMYAELLLEDWREYAECHTYL